ncbi:MAG: selenocysteine-specific translation elongation factor [Bacillota bacterium]|nr:selenocysteine-specific translation elongation factor [Bacillota bacterium]
MDDLIIGTAGHVDHGKTVLIKALTGVDTDRLQEEKERGISIDLGFAPFRLPGGRLAGVVDVPGHERFIHNMLAGAAGMDLVMLVVDASEGVMPQTREHLDILELLGIKNGIVVITKIDLVEEDWRELVREEIGEELKGTFLEEAPIHAVSAISGEGIEELKDLIDRQTTGIKPRNTAGPLRLPVDRSFVIAGFGTVITGTLIQGSVKVGDTVAVVPPGVEARVRNIQVHDDDLKEARAGTRVALNLSGLEKSQIMRGSVVSVPGFYRETGLIDVSVELLPRAARGLKNLDPVHFFLGTARSVARVLLLDRDELKPGEKTLAQCRLDKPLVTERGDPFVIRSYSPMTTIGGGKVLDPYPQRHRRFREQVINSLLELDSAAAGDDDTVIVRRKLEELIIADINRLARETRLDQTKVGKMVETLVSNDEAVPLGSSFVLSAVLNNVADKLVDELQKVHSRQPLSPGMSRASLKGFLPGGISQRDYDALLDKLQTEKKVASRGEYVSIHGYQPEPSAVDQNKLDTIIDLYRKSGLQPPGLREVLEKSGLKQDRKDEFFNYLQGKKVLYKVTDELFFHKDAYEEARLIIAEHFRTNAKMTLAEFRDKSGTSRKFAQALLEHFDQVKYTRRVEDYRVLLAPK